MLHTATMHVKTAEDLFETGIIDPTEVTRSALQNVIRGGITITIPLLRFLRKMTRINQRHQTNKGPA